MDYDVAIIGGGIISLFSAYYLTKEGKSVVIVEKDEIAKGSSYANAGYIVPSHFIPLANMGMVLKGLKWMFSSSSPFCIKPDIDIEFIKWSYNFLLSSKKSVVDSSIPILFDMNMSSLKEYQKLSNELNFELRRSGLMILFKDKKDLDLEKSVVNEGISLGLNAKILTKQEVMSKEGIELDIVGASYYEDDSIIDPFKVCTILKDFLIDSGVKILEDHEVKDFIISSNSVECLKVENSNEVIDLKAKDYIVANGAWLGGMAKKLGVSIPMRSGKGYSTVLKRDDIPIKTPMILNESKVAISPYEEFVRVGGSMEVCDIDFTKRVNRVNSIISSIPSYIPSYKQSSIDYEKFWVGLRPCSADGVPYIGKLGNYNNVFINSGHSMMGVSLAPISGKMITDSLVNGVMKYKESLDPLRFS